MRNLAFLLMLAVGLFGGLSVSAQEFTFFASDETAAVGGTAVVAIDFDVSDPLDGWSFGLCSDFTLTSVSASDVEDGPGTATADDGDEPFFQSIQLIAGQGLTIGVLVSSSGNQFQPGFANMYNISYSVLAEGTSAVSFCALGTPITEVNVIAGTPPTAIVPAVQDGSITGAVIPPFIFAFNKPGTVGYNPDDGLATFHVMPTIEEDAVNSPTFPSDSQGASIAFSYDAALVTAVDAEPGADLEFLNGNDGPDFFGPILTAAGPGGETGVTIGLIFDFQGADFGVFTTALEVADITFDTVPAALIGNLAGASMALTYMTLGVPPVENAVVVNSTALDVAFVDSSIDLVAIVATPFLAGDCNDDGGNDIADGIWILNELFQDGPAHGCFVACDANADGMLDQSDAVWIFNYQFLDGPPPAGSVGSCGVLADDQDCLSQESCL